MGAEKGHICNEVTSAAGSKEQPLPPGRSGSPGKDRTGRAPYLATVLCQQPGGKQGGPTNKGL